MNRKRILTGMAVLAVSCFLLAGGCAKGAAGTNPAAAQEISGASEAVPGASGASKTASTASGESENEIEASGASKTTESEAADISKTASEAAATPETAGASKTASGDLAASETAVEAAAAPEDSGASKTAAEAAGAPGTGDMLVTLGFAGDLNLSEGWVTTKEMDRRENGILDCFSEEVLSRMRGFDLFMLNNEFTYSKRGEPLEKTYTFRADPERVESLKALGVDLVLAANNHINDFGTSALLDSLETLDSAGIGRVGAGKNIEEAASPAFFECNGRKIAFVAASCAEEHEDTVWTVPAGEDAPGIFACYEPEAFYQAVGRAAGEADFVIACVHWGYEDLDYYSPEQQAMAQALVRAGADAVIGTHPHVLQGVEVVDGAPVFYSLGDFWFNEEDKMTGMAELTLRLPEDPKEAVRLEKTRFIPCTQAGLFVEEAGSEEERKQILGHLREISFGTWIGDDGTVAAGGKSR